MVICVNKFYLFERVNVIILFNLFKKWKNKIFYLCVWDFEIFL